MTAETSVAFVDDVTVKSTVLEVLSTAGWRGSSNAEDVASLDWAIKAVAPIVVANRARINPTMSARMLNTVRVPESMSSSPFQGRAAALDEIEGSFSSRDAEG